jgi:hypothetical protein
MHRNPGQLAEAIRGDSMSRRLICGKSSSDDLRECSNARAIAALQAAANPTRRPVQDHADAVIAIQSNQVFRTLATWARQEVTTFRDAGLREAFNTAVEDEAYRLCQGMQGDCRRAEQAIKPTAQSVAQWTWEKYIPAKPKPLALPKAEIQSRQAAGGKATAATRRSATETVILAALAKHKSAPISRSDLIAATGRSERTIRRYASLLAGVMTPEPTKAAPAIRSSL